MRTAGQRTAAANCAPSCERHRRVLPPVAYRRAVDHFFKHGPIVSHIEPTGEHETRKQDVGDPTTSTASLGTKILWHRPASRTGGGIPTRTSSDTTRRTIRSRELDLSAQPRRRRRTRAGPYDVTALHRLGPLPTSAPNCAGGSLAFRTLILARSLARRQCRSSRARPKTRSNAQAVRPSTHQARPVSPRSSQTSSSIIDSTSDTAH